MAAFVSAVPSLAAAVVTLSVEAAAVDQRSSGSFDSSLAAAKPAAEFAAAVADRNQLSGLMAVALDSASLQTADRHTMAAAAGTFDRFPDIDSAAVVAAVQHRQRSDA